MSAGLQQLNISYDPSEDRLLLRARGNDESEYRLWITRRYCQLLAGLLHQQLEQAGGPRELASHPATLDRFKGGAFEKPYQSPAQGQYPLGEDGVLGYRVGAERNASGQVVLRLLPAQGQGLTMTLDPPTLYLFHNLLEQALARADWRLPLPASQHEPVH